MCQMCDEYEAELRRMGIAMDDKVTVEFDGEVMHALSQRAEAHGHDVASEVRAIVSEGLSSENSSTAKRGGGDAVEAFRRIRAMTPNGVAQSDSTPFIREDRDHGHSIDRR